MATKDKDKDEEELETEADEGADESETESSSGEESDERDASEPEEGEEREAVVRAEGRDSPEGDGAGAPSTHEEGTQPAHLGATKYVHAAFFGAGMLAAYLSGKILFSVWNSLAEWPTAARALPFLLRYAEDDRETYTMIAGAIVGVIGVVQTYRKEHIRQWADEVATELSKVTWPNKDTVTNGTVVVVAATAIATVYITLLDRLWAFLTNLVYGA
jgi:preprotein translocase subunit SecE